MGCDHSKRLRRCAGSSASSWSMGGKSPWEHSWSAQIRRGLVG